MNKKDIENKIANSFANETPQIYDRIERNVSGLNVDRTVKRRPAAKNLFWKLASGVLSLVLVVMAIVGVVNNVNQTAQASSVSLDVNPSVQIVLNRNNRVVKVEALNDDGKIIIADMDFNGCQLKVAVNALIGSMLRNGFLSEDANSVLVSVDSNKNAYQSIAEAVANEITLTLGQMSIDASVVSQWIQNDDQAAAIAKQYNISLGKAQLINKIVAKTDYTVEQLADLTVNELSLLLPNIDIDDDNVNQSGNASAKQYINESEALQVALNAAKIEGLTAEAEGLKLYKNKLSFDDGEMVYEVEYVYGEYEYELEVGAISGKVVAFEKELNGYYAANTDNIVISNADEAKAYALALAGIEEDATNNLYAGQTWFFRGTVYEVCFRTDDMFYQYCVGADGVVLEEYYEMLNLSSDDSYLTRQQVNGWFIANNQDGFTRLDNLQRMRVTSEKTVDGRLIYTLSFVSNGNQYVYKIDAVNKTFVSREVSEYESAVKDEIKDKLYGMFEHDDHFAGMPWNFDDWVSDWDWDDDDEFEWTFEYEGNWYEVEIDRWGNVKYEHCDDGHGYGHNGPNHRPHF